MTQASYLLDTDILIDLIKDKYNIKDKVKKIGLVNCYISEISLAELFFGAHYSDRISKHRKESFEISSSIGVLPISDVLEEFGKEKARLVKAGLTIPDFDLLIASTAVKYDYVLVTGNFRHLGRVKGIKIENWRLADYNQFIK